MSTKTTLKIGDMLDIEDARTVTFAYKTNMNYDLALTVTLRPDSEGISDEEMKDIEGLLEVVNAFNPHH